MARAIADHYRPRFSGDDVPAERVGCIVAIADKLDTICGLFAIGQGPTGSSDPFALRRSALGIVTMLLSDKGLDISLGAAIDVALASYAAQGIEFDATAVRADVVDFFITRTRSWRREGAAPRRHRRCARRELEEPVVFMQRVRALVAAREQQAETFDDLATAYARANNLRDEKLGTNVDESLLGDENVRCSTRLPPLKARRRASRRKRIRCRFGRACEFACSHRRVLRRRYGHGRE